MHVFIYVMILPKGEVVHPRLVDKSWIIRSTMRYSTFLRLTVVLSRRKHAFCIFEELTVVPQFFIENQHEYGIYPRYFLQPSIKSSEGGTCSHNKSSVLPTELVRKPLVSQLKTIPKHSGY